MEKIGSNTKVIKIMVATFSVILLTLIIYYFVSKPEKYDFVISEEMLHNDTIKCPTDSSLPKIW
jgi:hypothetical protein